MRPCDEFVQPRLEPNLYRPRILAREENNNSGNEGLFLCLAKVSPKGARTGTILALCQEQAQRSWDVSIPECGHCRL
jgi:hypothetical protein